MTYASLQSDMRAYLERGDVTDTNVYNQLPRLIMLAEYEIAQEIKPQGFENYLLSTFVIGQYVYTKPNLWRETKHIEYGINATAAATGYNTRVPLFARSLEYCRKYWPDPTVLGTADDPPRFYAEYGPQHILIVPTPYQVNPYEWAVWQRLAPLSDSNQSNWLTQYAPNLILYASLLQAEPFLKNDDRIQVWQAGFDRAVSALLNTDARKAQDSSTKREEGVA